MPITRRSAVKTAVMFSLTWLGIVTVAADEQFSKANQILFDTDHFRSISEPTVLHYSFKKAMPDDTGFDDSINVRIGAVNADGSRNVALEYFTGDRKRYVPEVMNAIGNPVIVVYLQRDVNEMGRLTSGPWRHFQKRIKLALEATENVTTVPVSFEGRELEAREVRIEPYRDDPMRERYADYAEKYYVFTLAPDVPGYVFEIRSVVPGQGGAAVEEVLSYAGQTPAP